MPGLSVLLRKLVLRQRGSTVTPTTQPRPYRPLQPYRLLQSRLRGSTVMPTTLPLWLHLLRFQWRGSTVIPTTLSWQLRLLRPRWRRSTANPLTLYRRLRLLQRKDKDIPSQRLSSTSLRLSLYFQTRQTQTSPRSSSQCVAPPPKPAVVPHPLC